MGFGVHSAIALQGLCEDDVCMDSGFCIAHLINPMQTLEPLFISFFPVILVFRNLDAEPEEYP